MLGRPQCQKHSFGSPSRVLSPSARSPRLAGHRQP